MGLSDKREKMLKEMPIIRAHIARSKDGRFLIHRTTLTHIKPMAYYDAILKNTVKVTEEEIGEDLQEYLERK